MRIYLDACCLNRPFDDHAIDRNRLEAEAVLTILRAVAAGRWELVRSTVLDLELGQMPDPERRSEVQSQLAVAVVRVAAGPGEYDRMAELIPLGLRVFDALHIGCAESAGCDVLLTTDDRLLRKAKGLQSVIAVRVENPLTWIQEQLGHGHDDE